ncbi:MAG: ATP-dependent RecD-like DNA helicase [Hyphomicrobiales bacterium]
MLEHHEFSNIIYQELSFDPNQEQENLISLLSQFSLDPESSVFILKGYAGTGKTSIVSALVNSLESIKMKSVLLAPTGRAAKVLASYSNAKATTIHRKIYRLKTYVSGKTTIATVPNKHKDTIFIVDEASMISEYNYESGNIFSDQNLLADLIYYVQEGKNCKLILVGDTAQLPPVGIPISPALDAGKVEYEFQLKICEYELKMVMRQALESGILYNATQIREKIRNEFPIEPFFDTEGFKDIHRLNGGWELQEELSSAFYSELYNESIVICRSNKRANIYNREIRNRILYRENEIDSGDQLMVIKNNYFWLDSKKGEDFIANGDLIEVTRVLKTEELYGHRFADISIRFSDNDEEKELDVKVFLDTLMLDSPSLSYENSSKLYNDILNDYADLPTQRKRIEAVKNDPYYNALQIKYAYAMTCHKTQGGQWNNVFIDQGYVTPEMVDTEYLRWLYTAMTRATKKIHLIGFNPSFFK